MKIPKVSVVMPVYNEEKHVSRAIESILNQTFKDFEFVIIDDCSKDKTSRIIKEYKNKDLRIKIVTNKKREFIAKSLNKGIKIAKGEYIARMDGDDISLPERLNKQVCFMEIHPEISVLGSPCFVRDSKEAITSMMQVFSSDNQIKRILSLKLRAIIHPTAIIRKNSLTNVGMYNENLRDTEDKELWIRMAAKGYKFANLRESLLIRLGKKRLNHFKIQREKFRYLAFSITKNKLNLLQEKYKNLEIPFLLKNESSLLEKKAYNKLYLQLGEVLLPINEKLSKKSFFMAIRAYPFNKEAYKQLFNIYFSKLYIINNDQ